MPSLTFHINQQPDGSIDVYVSMPRTVCSGKETVVIDAILNGYNKEVKKQFEASDEHDESTRVKLGRG